MCDKRAVRARLHIIPLVGCLLLPAITSLAEDAAIPASAGNPCPSYLGQVFAGGGCICPNRSIRELTPEGRCMPDCPDDRARTCSRHDALLNAGRRDVSPADYCDCILRMRPDGTPDTRTYAGRDVPLSHCSPFTGEVLVDGKCACPPGTAFVPSGGLARCEPRRWAPARPATPWGPTRGSLD
jgi:hypothetical protein